MILLGSEKRHMRTDGTGGPDFQAEAEGLCWMGGYWRDLLAFTWRLNTFHGREAIKEGLSEARNRKQARDFTLEGEAFHGRLGEFGPTIEAFFKFETNLAHGRGFVRLLPTSSPGEFKALTLLTTMASLKAFPESRGANRDRTFMRTMEAGSKNWLDRRKAE